MGGGKGVGSGYTRMYVMLSSHELDSSVFGKMKKLFIFLQSRYLGIL